MTSCRDPAAGLGTQSITNSTVVPSGWRRAAAATAGFGIQVDNVGGTIFGSVGAPVEARPVFDAPLNTTISSYTLYRALRRPAQGTYPMLATAGDPGDTADWCHVFWSGCQLDNYGDATSLWGPANRLARFPGAATSVYASLLCDVASAELRVYSTASTPGRTIEALRLGSAWNGDTS